MQKPIYSITPFTLLDYPDHTACILWFAGCNMRCLYCYNPEIVLGKGTLTIEDTLQFLASRKHLLNGVVFSGGECTLHSGFPEMVRAAKEMGFLVKIDTNGSRPNVLEALIHQGYVDYVALDFKALAKSYAGITRSHLHADFEKSLHLLQESRINFEVRTTWHRDLISTTELHEMVSYLSAHAYHGTYYVQHYVNHVTTLSPLPFSVPITDSSLFSTAQIEVVFRRS
ncbi:anaerobic ribonucleoside-triphosphate reductase activating protein [Sphingobacterium lumbrici]|uniref:anaerobic ribonucleoside-triphosphate reductase activating protein n=1 Tax=Sphingobacterium lumbrici TaxID=2559600 RepID=UPI001125E78D|nr:anaerobic ribonucleoside-triphosphate reductase activating protein [Sphingobacterium lumbrici]